MEVATDGAEKLLLVLGLLPVVGFVVIASVLKMIDGEFSVGTGLLAIFATFAVLAMAAFANHPVVTVAVFVGLTTLAATYPFASDQLSRVDHARADLHRLDRAYQAYCARPDNAAARFALAQALADHGLLGHAVVVSEQTLATLSEQIDATTNQSMRGVFRNEEHQARNWRRTAKPQDFRPVKCPQCGTFNEAGHLFCKKCAALHLLDVARGGVSRARVGQRLVAAWAVLALVVGGVAMASQQLRGAALGAVIVGGLGVAGIVLGFLFQPSGLRA